MPTQLPAQILNNDGVEIAYYTIQPAEGTVPRDTPVLLIHGFASNAHINWVYPGWTDTLSKAGYQVVAMDNRGHGQSSKLYDQDAYYAATMADDAYVLLNHLGWDQAHIMGYSMGARLSAFLSLEHPERVRSVVFGGLGMGMITGVGGAQPIVDALLADDPATISNDIGQRFRAFAEATGSDRRALAACMASTRQLIDAETIATLRPKALIAVGSSDDIAGSGAGLAELIPGATFLEIPRRDHQLAVGDKVFKAGVLDFWDGI